jgi:hypothetical protein
VNCDVIHRRLLALERPDRPPADLRKHLACCSVCRAWHEHLVQLERDVPRLPVPSPKRKNDFFAQLAREPQPIRLGMTRPPANGKRERGMKKMALAVALAASLLVIAGAVWVLNQDHSDNKNRHATGEGKGKENVLEKRLEAYPRWKTARTSREKIEVLDSLAIKVEKNAIALASANSLKELEQEVKVYREAVAQLTKEAPFIGDGEEREKVLRPVQRRLAQVESQAKRLAERVPDAAEFLTQLAMVAKQGDNELRLLLPRVA